MGKSTNSGKQATVLPELPIETPGLLPLKKGMLSQTMHPFWPVAVIIMSNKPTVV